MIYIICIATFIATIAGGIISLKYQAHFNIILAFSGGAVVGVALFDLLPTAMELAGERYSLHAISSLAGLGFTLYLIIDRVLLYFKQSGKISTNFRGTIAASMLTLHSLLDGVAIGLAFHLSMTIGGIIAAAILVHDFADGMNTANVLLKENGNKKQVWTWLLINALAPMIGAASTYYYQFPGQELGLILALITGFFLYIGAADFLPHSVRSSDTPGLTIATLAGIILLYLAVQIAGI